MATQKTLLEETLFLLDNDKRNAMELSRASGVSYFWILKIKRRETVDPGVIKIEKLHKALTSVSK